MYEYEIEYSAQGHFYNRYQGTITVRSNYDDESIVADRARTKIARDGCFSPALVTIKSIKRINF